MILADIFIILGVILSTLGCLGVVRFFDLYTRLHSATLVATWGTYSIMLGIFIKSGLKEIGIKALLVIFLMLLLSPTTSHIIARLSHQSGIKPQGTALDELEEDTFQNNKLRKEPEIRER